MGEVEKLVMQYQQGEKQLFPAIWTAVRATACRIALRYSDAARRNGGADDNDLCQLAAVGVWKAAQSFCAAEGSKFVVWSVFHIRAEIQRALALHCRCIENTSTAALDAPLEAFDGDATLVDTLADKSATDPQEAAVCADLQARVREAVEELPAQERDAVRLVYLEGMKQQEAAELMGCSSTQTQGALSRARRRLRKSPQIRALYLPHYHTHVGLKQFRTTWTSTVELVAIAHEEEEENERRHSSQ